MYEKIIRVVCNTCRMTIAEGTTQTLAEQAAKEQGAVGSGRAPKRVHHCKLCYSSTPAAISERKRLDRAGQ